VSQGTVLIQEILMGMKQTFMVNLRCCSFCFCVAAAAIAGDGYENMRAIATSKFIYKFLT
jgi:hypothetical protein